MGGGRVSFLDGLQFGVALERKSEILSVRAKLGSTGPLLFITIGHCVTAMGVVVVQEEQGLVFREPAPVSHHRAQWDHLAKVAERFHVTPDEAMLFRFSALTINAHRIHYHRDYAATNGYPGQVVQGPLLATLLMHHFGRHAPSASVKGFKDRALRPAFAGRSIELRLAWAANGAILEAIDDGEKVLMSADIEAV